ncbi:signal peptidase I [Reinekea marinisedimentorum]|uniref:Signal peptidase I n=1 Tax=Reinekea marinisedimentorum TaxID=230495 RepID=A0A4R3HY32_9GAMM|nr:signal peptidase I [Reinekea marinisedimentorum]TCS36379.1 signal peptidase I [Reinekea marinisedimentorum]
MAGVWNYRLSLGFDLFQVQSVSMHPALHEGDLVVVRLNKANSHHSFNKGDIIVFNDPNVKKMKLIKRIAYVPGESVTYSKLITVMDDKTHRPVAYREQQTLEHINGYFVLGDNPKHSTDSRNFGPIDPSQIVGKVFFTIPKENLGWLYSMAAWLKN